MIFHYEKITDSDISNELSQLFDDLIELIRITNNYKWLYNRFTTIK